MAWSQLAELREPAKLRAWLCGIARNRIHTARRRDRREPSHKAEAIDRAPEPRAPEAMPSDQAVSREEAVILWRVLERLPENYREPLVLFYREHQSVERVAAALELSEEVIRQRLSRGRKLLEAEVAAFLAGALECSAPGPTFTMGVLAVLPVLTMTAKITAAETVAAKSGAIAKLAAVAASAEAFVPLLAQVLLTFVGRRRNRETLAHLRRSMPAKDWARFDTYQRELKRRGEFASRCW